MSGKAEKLYNALSKKYKKMPDFKQLDSEFELSSMKEDEVNELYFSRIVRRRIYEKFYNFNIGLVTIINPQVPSIILSHENKFFSNDDRDLIMSIVNKLMKVEREHLILETEFDESKDADFITSSFGVWIEVKPSIKKILTVMKDSWGREAKFKTEDYFG